MAGMSTDGNDEQIDDDEFVIEGESDDDRRLVTIGGDSE